MGKGNAYGHGAAEVVLGSPRPEEVASAVAADLAIPVYEVEVWGPEAPVEDVARAARTISGEALARTAQRIPRVVLEAGQVRAVRAPVADG